MSGLQKLLALWRVGGALSVANALRKRFLTYRWRSLVLTHATPLDAAELVLPSGYCFALVSGPNKLRPTEVQALKRDGAGMFLESLASTDCIYVVWAGAEVASYGAVMTQSPQHSVLGLPQSACLIGLCETVPAHQRRGLFSLGLMQTVRRLRERGLSEIYIEVDESNMPSRGGITKAGFEHFATVDARVLFGILVYRSGRWHRLKRGS